MNTKLAVEKIKPEAFLSFLKKDPYSELNPLSPPLATVKNQALESQVPIVHDQVGILLQLFVELIQPQHILEIGSGIGYSTLWMGQASGRRSFTLIENNPERAEKLKQNLAEWMPHLAYHLCTESAQTFLNKGRTSKERANIPSLYDFIFLDSTKKEYSEIFAALQPCLAPKAWLVVDNIGFMGRVFMRPEEVQLRHRASTMAIHHFNQMLLYHPNWQTSFLGVGDGLLIAHKRV